MIVGKARILLYRGALMGATPLGLGPGITCKH